MTNATDRISRDWAAQPMTKAEFDAVHSLLVRAPPFYQVKASEASRRRRPQPQRTGLTAANQSRWRG
jgi:hypothetical protein